MKTVYSIQDDIEYIIPEEIKNQICKNCEYYEKYPSVCCNGYSPLCAEVVDEDFGCNRFSKKE